MAKSVIKDQKLIIWYLIWGPIDVKSFHFPMPLKVEACLSYQTVAETTT